jgi:ParB-like chromosome segregation protein Spo0J
MMREQLSETRRAESAGRQLIKELRRGGKRQRRLAEHMAACSVETPCKGCPACLLLTSEVVPPEGAIPQPVSPATRTIPVEAIRPVFNQRPLIEGNLEMIMNSVSVNGMRHPISVIALGDHRYGLLDGAYRLAAQQRLGASEILCSIEANEDAAKRWNLAANLSRVDLTALEQALSINAYLSLVRQAVQDGQLAHPGGHQPNDKGFSRVAGELGWSREKIRRATAIAKLSADAQAVARDLGLADNEQQLLAAAKQPNSDAQALFLRALKERRPVKGTAKRDRPHDSLEQMNPMLDKNGQIAEVPARPIASLVPDLIDANGDGLEVPAGLLLLSSEDQKYADELWRLWSTASARVQQHLLPRMLADHPEQRRAVVVGGRNLEGKEEVGGV